MPTLTRKGTVHARKLQDVVLAASEALSQELSNGKLKEDERHQAAKVVLDLSKTWWQLQTFIERKLAGNGSRKATEGAAEVEAERKIAEAGGAWRDWPAPSPKNLPPDILGGPPPEEPAGPVNGENGDHGE